MRLVGKKGTIPIPEWGVEKGRHEKPHQGLACRLEVVALRERAAESAVDHLDAVSCGDISSVRKRLGDGGEIPRDAVPRVPRLVLREVLRAVKVPVGRGEAGREADDVKEHGRTH